jgi:GNAT superfamily N-acetyltransferase
MELRVSTYEDWMSGQVADLFHREYGQPREEIADGFRRFYEHPYQRERAVRVVVLDGEKVAAFTGFIFWPYVREGRQFNSYQGMNVLVDPAYRGTGCMQRILGFVDENRERLNIEFLLAFPIAASRKCFARDNWHNILDLQWYVKLVNPLAFRSSTKMFRTTRETPAAPVSSRFRLSTDPEFLEWRDSFTREQRLFRSSLELKLSRRARVLRELIVGDVRAENFGEALRDVVKAARRSLSVTFVSCLVNPADSSAVNVLLDTGFRKMNRTITLFVKPFEITPVADPAQWTLFRSDIDTW